MAERLLIIQYGGDYRMSFLHFNAGGDEFYHAQKYAVDAVAKMPATCDEVATLCCYTKEAYNTLLAPGLRAMGLGSGTTHIVDTDEIINIAAEYQPTRIVLMTPMPQILRWAIRNKIRTITALADSFTQTTLKGKIKGWFSTKILANLLNHPQIEWVGNHGMNAAQSLVDIGVKPQKIIPWDYPHEVSPADYAVKSLADPKTAVTGQAWRLLFVGSICEIKGVGDILTATATLNQAGFPVKAQIAGSGEVEMYQRRAEDLGIADRVEFLGRVKNKEIIPLMHQADLVLIPSHHVYPEGFPFTIFEALASRTPIMASDHPMFRGKLVDRESAIVFQASNPQSLAQGIQTLLTDPALYAQLSQAALPTWEGLLLPVVWADFINRWLADTPENVSWLRQQTLAAEMDA